MNIQTCKYIEVTEVVPKDWLWFFGMIAENCPFSWGDNNRTMIHRDRFYDCARIWEDVAVEDFDVTREEYDAFLVSLQEIPEDVYIDMEH